MKIILNGVCGRMGQAVTLLAAAGCRNAEIVAGMDVLECKDKAFPCYTSWEDVNENADCIIDFSNHAGTAALLEYAVENKLPVVIATTGHTDDEKKLIDEAAKSIPVFMSANMSPGVALLVELAKTATKNMPDADIEIIEKHHNRKLDAPSGTALMIANAIKSVREKAQFVFGRQGQAKREKNDVGIHAIRMGNIVGEHEVIIGTDNETITLKHEAHNRALFAEGAIAAAQFIAGRNAGMYSMQDIVKEQ